MTQSAEKDTDWFDRPDAVDVCAAMDKASEAWEAVRLVAPRPTGVLRAEVLSAIAALCDLYARLGGEHWCPACARPIPPGATS